MVTTADKVTWTVWNPDGEWGLLLGSAPQGVAEIQVNGQRAVLEEGNWWFYSPHPVNPPISIRAFDPQQRELWSTP